MVGTLVDKNLVGRCGLYCGFCLIYRAGKDSEKLRGQWLGGARTLYKGVFFPIDAIFIKEASCLPSYCPSIQTR